MKNLLLTLVTLFAFNIAYSQDGPPLGGEEWVEVCNIYYAYDATGQRVKREYDCRFECPNCVTGPDRPIRVNEFPNPTDGDVNVVTDVSVDIFEIRIYTIDGLFLQLRGCESCNHINTNIGSYADGTYILHAIIKKEGYDDQEESFTIIKK